MIEYYDPHPSKTIQAFLQLHLRCGIKIYEQKTLVKQEPFALVCNFKALLVELKVLMQLMSLLSFCNTLF